MISGIIKITAEKPKEYYIEPNWTVKTYFFANRQNSAFCFL